jgi:phosphatidylserine decarboxylase
LKVSKKYTLIAKEGWPFLGIAIAFSLCVSAYYPLWSALPWLLSIFILQFFRDPKRKTPANSNLIISAADGKVIAIEETTDPYQKKKSIKISVFMNVFNVHSNKVPVSGTIINKWYFPGKFLNADFEKASLENERCAITIKTKTNHTITCVQIAGLIARRILCYIKKEDEVKTGERYGFIRFGSRVDLYLPINSEIKVILGQTVKNAETIIARLN